MVGEGAGRPLICINAPLRATTIMLHRRSFAHADSEYRNRVRVIDSVQTKLDKLEAVLAKTSTSSQDAALLAEILSLSNDGRYPKLSLNPGQWRQRTLSALMAQVEALLQQNPVLMIFEDAHWMDPRLESPLPRANAAGL
jgi:hypothetical protein